MVLSFGGEKIIKSRYFLEFFVFITGGSIMILEMTAFKALIPYFGTAIYAWGVIISLIITALSLGYFLGGKLADSFPNFKGLTIVVLISGVLVGLIPLLMHYSIFDLRKILSEVQGPLLLCFILPIFLLGMASPYAIRLKNKFLETTGYATGSIFAISTFGSIIGTFLASFVLLPLFGSKTTLLITSIILIILGAICLIFTLKNISILRFFSLVLILILPIFSYAFSNLKAKNIVYEKESFYGLIRVFSDEEIDGQNWDYVLEINSSGRWSVFSKDKVLTGMYFDYFTPLYYLLDKKRDEPVEVLIIGHAGGVFSKQYSHFFKDKNVNIDGVELDPEVTKVAKRYFDIDTQAGLQVFNEDGRLFLQNNNKKYDIILMDAYTGALYIPFYLVTKEFLELTYSRLKEGGLIAYNVLSYSQKERVAKCLSQTAKHIYPYSYFIKTTDSESILLASKTNLDQKLSNLAERVDVEELRPLAVRISNNFSKVDFGNCILTDNKSPTEMLRELDKLFIKRSEKNKP